MNRISRFTLTCVSCRYRENDVLAEAQTIFPKVAVARDFDSYQIKRGEVTKVADS